MHFDATVGNNKILREESECTGEQVEGVEPSDRFIGVIGNDEDARDLGDV